MKRLLRDARPDDDWGQFYVVGVTVQLLRDAADLAESYGLRAYDSIHLAAAEAVQRLAGVGGHDPTSDPYFRMSMMSSRGSP